MLYYNSIKFLHFIYYITVFTHCQYFPRFFLKRFCNVYPVKLLFFVEHLYQIRPTLYFSVKNQPSEKNIHLVG